MVKTGVEEASSPPQDENTLLLHNKGSRTVRRAEFDTCAAVLLSFCMSWTLTTRQLPGPDL